PRDWSSDVCSSDLADIPVAVGIDVLAQELNLPISLLGQGSRFPKNGASRLTYFTAARGGNDAVGAGLIATFHDGHEGLGPRGSSSPGPIEPDAVVAPP